MRERDCARSIEHGRRAMAVASAPRDKATVGRAELHTGAACDLRGAANVLALIESSLGELMHLAEADACLSGAVALTEADDFNGVYPRAWVPLCWLLAGHGDEAAGFASAVVSRRRCE